MRDLVPLSAFLSVIIGFVTRFSAFGSPGVIATVCQISREMDVACFLYHIICIGGTFKIDQNTLDDLIQSLCCCSELPLTSSYLVCPFPPPPLKKNQPFNRGVRFKNGVAQCTSTVTNISSCQGNAISRRGIVQLGCSFGFIFLCFLYKKPVLMLIVAGENPRPLALSDIPAMYCLKT